MENKELKNNWIIFMLYTLLLFGVGFISIIFANITDVFIKLGGDIVLGNIMINPFSILGLIMLTIARLAYDKQFKVTKKSTQGEDKIFLWIFYLLTCFIFLQIGIMRRNIIFLLYFWNMAIFYSFFVYLYTFTFIKYFPRNWNIFKAWKKRLC